MNDMWVPVTILAVAMCVALFNGDPDMADALREAAQHWAATVGRECRP